MPCGPCTEGKKAVDAERRGEVAGCPWFVADAESCYCIWKFLDDRGDGRPVPPARIARMLMVDDAVVRRVVSKFKSEFRDIVLPDGKPLEPSAAPDPEKSK